jgi:GNAT superfamily N-acetyltransferase
MSFAAFERLPRTIGWKHEYYGGKAHIRPAHLMVRLLLNLVPQKLSDRPGIRRVRRADAGALEAGFLNAFALAPEYADYPPAHFRARAAEYIEGFFGNVRGRWSRDSVLAEVDGHLVGAALVKCGAADPLLDCLFVHPEFGRQGWATALVRQVAHKLLKKGIKRLRSCVLLANAPSLAWHKRFGFAELPDLWIADYRWHTYAYDLARRRRLKLGTDEELERLADEAEHWRAEAERLRQSTKRDFWAGYPEID